MTFVTQGTIQVQVDLNNKEYSVAINPAPEYTVTHRGKKYIVSMPAETDAKSAMPQQAQVCLIEELELGRKTEEGPLELCRAKVPAPPAPESASRR